MASPARSLVIGSMLLSFAVSFSALAYRSYRETSATWDEPIHLTTGHAAAALGDHRFDPEHPPFARMWAALPLRFVPNLQPLRVDAVDEARPRAWAWFEQFRFAHRFLYVENDADRLLYPARAMIVALGVLLGVLVFAWAYELGGLLAGGLALVGCLLEPNLMAHASLVTTDMALTCFFFATVYFLWRTSRRRSVGNVLGLASSFALAMISKYSALLLVPVVVVLLAVAVFRLRTLRLRVACGLLLLLAATSWLAIWAAYHFRYDPSTNQSWTYHFQYDPVVGERVPQLAKAVSALDGLRILPSAYTQGFLLSQAKAVSRGAFLAGDRRSTGWWYYFPIAFLVKTPVALMVLAAGAAWLVVLRWRRRGLGDEVFGLVPVAFVLAAAMSSNLNIGHRHILPIQPFLVLAASLAAARLVLRNRVVGGVVLAVLLAFWAYEFRRAYPHNLAFFNTLAGGPEHGHEWLVDSNLDWGQDLKGLARWLEEHEIEHVNLAYFGSADPRYYGIDATYLQGSPLFIPDEEIEEPRLPGYVAVSATLLVGTYGNAEERETYRGLREREPVAVIGHSIRVYRVTEPWQ